MFVAQKEPKTNAPSVDELTFIQARNPIKGSRPEDELPGLLKSKAEPRLIVGSAPFKCGAEESSVSRGQRGCLRIHRLSLAPYRQALKRCFFEPTEAVVRLYNRLNEPTKQLVEEWWERIETSRRFSEHQIEIIAYCQHLKPGDTTLLGLVAEVGQGMVTANNGRFLGYLDGTPRAEGIWRRREILVSNWQQHPRVGPVFRQLLSDHQNDFHATVEPLKVQFHWKDDLGLQKGEIYRIVPPESVAVPEDFDRALAFRKSELEETWSKSPIVRDYYGRLLLEEHGDFFTVFTALFASTSTRTVSLRELGLQPGESYHDPSDSPRVAAIFNGFQGKRHWVPFRKGDTEGHRWTTPDPLYIDWTDSNVRYLQTAPEARWQGHSFFFLPGVTWTRHGNHVALKGRLQPGCVFDANGSRLTPFGGVVTTNELLAILNTDLFSYIVKKFVKNTQDYEINDLRMAPIVIPTVSQSEELGSLAKLAIDAKEQSLKHDEPTVSLVRDCQRLTERQADAPTYLQPDSQIVLLHTADDCLAIVELAINWVVERLYGVEGLGPFNEF